MAAKPVVPAAGFSFTSFTAAAPLTPQPGNSLDSELEQIRQTGRETLSWAAGVISDSGQIQPGAVSPRHFSSEAALLIAGGWSPRGIWLTATAYALNDFVREPMSNNAYVCLEAHTSSADFDTDLAAVKWVLVSFNSSVPTPLDPLDNDKELVADNGTFGWAAKAITAAQISDASPNGRSLIQAANFAAMRALVSPLIANGDLWTRTGGVNARLGVGAEGTILGSVGGVTAYTNRITMGTPQDATGSPSTIMFSSIPSWVRAFSLVFSRFSTSGISIPLIRLGDAASLHVTGYLGSGGQGGVDIAHASYTTGFGVGQSHNASNELYGEISFKLVNAALFVWACSGQLSDSDVAATRWLGGRKTLNSVLDRVAVTTVGGTDTIDGASIINILY